MLPARRPDAVRAQAAANQDNLQDQFWHDHYYREPYYVSGRGYDQYRPAYELGWQAAEKYPGDFASVWPLLEAQWPARCGVSLLDWRQVSAAVRAGWERMRYVEPVIGLSRTQLLGVMQGLQRLNLLTANTLRAAHAQTPRGILQQMLQRHLQHFESAAAELAHEFGLPLRPNSMRLFSGPLLRGWETIKAVIEPDSIHHLLDASEDAERTLLMVYRSALHGGLPESVRVLLQRQTMAVQRGIEALHWQRSCQTL